MRRREGVMPASHSQKEDGGEQGQMIGQHREQGRQNANEPDRHRLKQPGVSHH